jgi:hypothetical protein
MLYGRRQCDKINGCGKIYPQHHVVCDHCGVQDAFSDLLLFNPLDWVYDLETYPNVFTASFMHPLTATREFFEVSERTNDIEPLVKFLNSLKSSESRLVGFNNIGFDYPIIHFIMSNVHTGLDIDAIYGKAASIIATDWKDRFNNVIWDSDTLIPQIDLYKIHHFDNEARSTSLKLLEFNMRSQSIVDLPFEPGKPLSIDQIPTLCKYNDHDVDETVKFYAETIGQIEFRKQLSAKYSLNFLNHNDTKIGKDYFIMELERLVPGSCYTRVNNKRVPRQTIRPTIDLGKVIFPYITFEQEGFNRIKTWLASQKITETKGVFKDLNCEIDGFKYVFGLGGIHGSIESSTVHSDNDYVIYDWDVASYYPNIAIANRLYPEHLGEEFCDIYKDVYEQRRSYKKGTVENAMLKLALNGVYGDSNNKYSPFYDPQYTMAITINGQLLLCMLAEQLIKIPNLEMVQINTDGLTVKCPRVAVEYMKNVCEWWEKFTCLQLESAVYSTMFVRDVNNYIAQYEDGSLKRKGAYEYNLEWHQNQSALVIPKAVEAALIRGEDVETFIKTHDDIFDFMLRTKVGRADQLVYAELPIPSIYQEQQLQRITRYYIAKDGGVLTKVSPPAKGNNVGTWKRATKLTDQYYESIKAEISSKITDGLEIDSDGFPWDERINTKNKSKYEIRRTSVNAGWLVSVCNDMVEADRNNIDYDYYISEAKKLIDILR